MSVAGGAASGSQAALVEDTLPETQSELRWAGGQGAGEWGPDEGPVSDIYLSAPALQARP